MSRSRGEEFDVFAAAWSARLVRSAYLLCGDWGAAEDLVQDVLERLYCAWPRVNDPAAYARRALANQVSNRWRRRARRPEVPLTAAHDPTTADGADLTADRDLLRRALLTLPPGQRAVIVLRYFEDLTEADCAATLRCSPGTVKSQTARAMARLRAELGGGWETETTSTVRSER